MFKRLVVVWGMWCVSGAALAETLTWDIERIGLTGSEFTSSYGYQVSNAQYLNDQGQVAGNSTRFNRATPSGLSVWLYDQGQTFQIGLAGGGYTRSTDGYQYSFAQDLNDLGQVIGGSYRYSGTASTGFAAWLYDQGQTTQIGLTGSGYTRSSDGRQNSQAQDLNNHGQVIGNSQRYNGTAATGQTAWLYDQGQTIQIGPTGSGYTRSSDGYQYSVAQALNDQVQVIGHSKRYNGTTETGYTSWLYDQGQTIQMGLTGSGHTRSSDGYQYSVTHDLNEQGQVTGSSKRYSGANEAGYTAWLYDQGQTTQIGLTGSGYTRSSDDYQYSYAEDLNDTGQVAGISLRYNGTTETGNSAWLYDQGQTIQIGLTGSGYTRTSDGYQYSVVQDLNDLGQVTGSSLRYNGTTEIGQSAWLYDSATNQTFDLTFSVGNDGYAYSEIAYLGDDGLALGQYSLFDNTGANQGNRAFYFTMEDGMVDLTEMLQLSGTDFTEEGWVYLSNAVRSNSQGQIIGTGLVAGSVNSQAAYLLTASPVPVPAAVWLLGSALLGFAGFARRK